jgi:hypothetical protein
MVLLQGRRYLGGRHPDGNVLATTGEVSPEDTHIHNNKKIKFLNRRKSRKEAHDQREVILMEYK